MPWVIQLLGVFELAADLLRSDWSVSWPSLGENSHSPWTSCWGLR